MKSSGADLRKRGMASQEEIDALAGASPERLHQALQDEDACTRSAAAINLRPIVDEAAEALLRQLAREKRLYTKIAICECLEKGSVKTAEKMTYYLGAIGNNQHKKVPEKVSAKKSFPLPRDIIARTLGKMEPAVLPALVKIIQGTDLPKICEALDAMGFMVFYHQELANIENVGHIHSLIERYPNNPLILWKCVLCLSAFPLADSRRILLRFAQEEGVLGMEAQRSLNLLTKRSKPIQIEPRP